MTAGWMSGLGCLLFAATPTKVQLPALYKQSLASSCGELLIVGLHLPKQSI